VALRKRLSVLLATMAVALLVASSAALAVTRVGTDANDYLRGTDGNDTLVAKGGDDVLLAFEGTDALSGGAGRDAVLGGNRVGPQGGEKTLEGGQGGDFVGGGRARDVVAGGPGRDFVSEGEAFGPPGERQQDVVSGGSGADRIEAKNVPAARDVVDCGGGLDWVLVDSKDLTSNCEREFTNVHRFYSSLSDYYFELLSRV
jgi:hypothetical protein